MTDFEIYINEYKGSVIPDAVDFHSIAIEATAFVDNFIVTEEARKLLQYPKVLQRYNFAVCSVADVIYTQSKQNNNKISESVGNHSVSYNIRTAEEFEKEKRSKALTFLCGTGLLYGGLH
ncbi:MAG: hypothetical protein NC397_08965 [Clostridium sp.]|nr:hypothetical protein [Clostridium sp.]